MFVYKYLKKFHNLFQFQSNMTAQQISAHEGNFNWFLLHLDFNQKSSNIIKMQFGRKNEL